MIFREAGLRVAGLDPGEVSGCVDRRSFLVAIFRPRREREEAAGGWGRDFLAKLRRQARRGRSPPRWILDNSNHLRIITNEGFSTNNN